MNKEQLKQIAHLLSREIMRYKKYKTQPLEDDYIKHHAMLVDTLDEVKTIISKFKRENKAKLSTNK